MQKDLKRYAELKRQEKDIKAELELLKKPVMDLFEEHQADEIDTDEGMFIKASRRKYNYTEPTQKLEEELKERKADEEARGTADYEENFYVIFKSV